MKNVSQGSAFRRKAKVSLQGVASPTHSTTFSFERPYQVEHNWQVIFRGSEPKTFSLFIWVNSSAEQFNPNAPSSSATYMYFKIGFVKEKCSLTIYALKHKCVFSAVL